MTTNKDQEVEMLLGNAELYMKTLHQLSRSSDPDQTLVTYQMDGDGNYYADGEVSVAELAENASVVILKLMEELIKTRITSKARKDCVIHYFEKWKATKDIALKYPDLPVKDVLDMVVANRSKEKQDAEQG